MIAESAANSAAEDPAQEQLAWATALLEDLDLTQVQRWKEKNPGALAVGYLPVYAPRPLIEALGALPVGIFGGGDQIDIIRGDSYFQSYICHIPRSTIELALGGRYACLDGMLFPSTCDVIRNLSGMWQMLFPDVYTAYLDLPQTFDPEIGGRFYAHELRRVAADLTARGAQPLEAEAFWAALERENTRRAALHELEELRQAEPWRVRASEAYLVARAGAVLTAAEHTGMVRDFLTAVRARKARPYDNVRVVLQGSFCEQPPIGLIRTLEKAGCDIVADDYQLALHYIQGDIEVPPPGERAGVDPMDALVSAFLELGVATACRYIDEGVKGAALVKKVRESGADGVVFAAASFCDPALLDQPMMEQALTRAAIPYTSLKFAENSGQFQTIREQAGAFSDSVKLWGTMP